MPCDMPTLPSFQTATWFRAVRRWSSFATGLVLIVGMGLIARWEWTADGNVNTFAPTVETHFSLASSTDGASRPSSRPIRSVPTPGSATGHPLAVHPTAGHSGGASFSSPPPEYDVQAIEKQVHRLVNQERTEHRMPALEWVDSLRTLGVVHSRDMRDRDFFRHTNPDGETINDRADTLGLHCRRIDGDTVYGFGENLYKATLYIQYRDFYEDSQFLRREYEWKTESSIAREIVDGWMDSPGHRQNILTQGYDVEAIGIVADRKRFYVTQVFC